MPKLIIFGAHHLQQTGHSSSSAIAYVILTANETKLHPLNFAQDLPFNYSPYEWYIYVTSSILKS